MEMIIICGSTALILGIFLFAVFNSPWKKIYKVFPAQNYHVPHYSEAPEESQVPSYHIGWVPYSRSQGKSGTSKRRANLLVLEDDSIVMTTHADLFHKMPLRIPYSKISPWREVVKYFSVPYYEFDIKLPDKTYKVTLQKTNTVEAIHDKLFEKQRA